MAHHITEKMKSFIDARRSFLQNNRPECVGKAYQLRRGVTMQSSIPFGPYCTSVAPVRLIDQGTPPQWYCAGCRRSWTYEPEPADDASA